LHLTVSIRATAPMSSCRARRIVVRPVSQKSPDGYRDSEGPQHLLIDIEPERATDSSEPARGIKVEDEGEWYARQHGGPKRRVWRKIHIGIDEQTLEVRAIEVTGSHIGDAPILPDLIDQIPPDQDIGAVATDGAYDTRTHTVVRPSRIACYWYPGFSYSAANENFAGFCRSPPNG
jgi:hypothetical protein